MPRSDASRLDDGVLESEGDFRMRVPAGWRVHGIAGVRYDVTHDEVDVHVTVSVARTGAQPVDAVATVLAFARREGATGDLETTEPASPDGAPRALVRFEAGDRSWSAVVMRASGGTVLASASAPVGDPAALDAGERMLASIGPSARRGRLRRRRG